MFVGITLSSKTTPKQSKTKDIAVQAVTTAEVMPTCSSNESCLEKKTLATTWQDIDLKMNHTPWRHICLFCQHHNFFLKPSGEGEVQLFHLVVVCTVKSVGWCASKRHLPLVWQNIPRETWLLCWGQNRSGRMLPGCRPCKSSQICRLQKLADGTGVKALGKQRNSEACRPRWPLPFTLCVAGEGGISGHGKHSADDERRANRDVGDLGPSRQRRLFQGAVDQKTVVMANEG